MKTYAKFELPFATVEAIELGKATRLSQFPTDVIQITQTNPNNPIFVWVRITPKEVGEDFIPFPHIPAIGVACSPFLEQWLTEPEFIARHGVLDPVRYQPRHVTKNEVIMEGCMDLACTLSLYGIPPTRGNAMSTIFHHAGYNVRYDVTEEQQIKRFRCRCAPTNISLSAEVRVNEFRKEGGDRESIEGLMLFLGKETTFRLESLNLAFLVAFLGRPHYRIHDYIARDDVIASLEEEVLPILRQYLTQRGVATSTVPDQILSLCC